MVSGICYVEYDMEMGKIWLVHGVQILRKGINMGKMSFRLGFFGSVALGWTYWLDHK